MATEFKILGQAAPAATAPNNVYTVPASTQAVISTIVVANRSSAEATFRISARPNGDAQANQHYLAYDVAIPGNDSTTLTLGITMGAADVLTVYGSSANLSWNVFGTEITP